MKVINESHKVHYDILLKLLEKPKSISLDLGLFKLSKFKFSCLSVVELELVL